MNPILAKLTANKQATWSVIAYAILEAIPQAAAIWLPESQADKIYETCRVLSKAVLGYALIMTAHQTPAVPPPAGDMPPLTPKL